MFLYHYQEPIYQQPIIIPFTNTKLKKIVNVYHKTNNIIMHGLGDYLRGCFCLIQICKKLGLEFDIYIQKHPLSKFLQNSNPYNIEYDKIPTSRYQDFNDMNHICINYCTIKTDSYNFYNKVINMLNNYDTSRTNTFCVVCYSFPIVKLITPNVRQIMRSKLIPNQEIQTYINVILSKVGLEKKQFGLIHIRSGDKYLKDKQNIQFKFANQMENIVKKIQHNSKPFFF